MGQQRHRPTRRALLALAAGALGSVAFAACGAAQGNANVSATTQAAAPTSAAAGQSTAPGGSTTQASTRASTPAVAAATGVAAATTATRLTFWCDIGGPYVDLAGKWAKEYTQAHPTVSVEYVNVASDYANKLSAGYAGGTPPDVFRYLQEQIPIDAAVQRSMLLPLDQYVDRDKYDLSAFLPESVTLYRWDGKLYALPRDYGAQFVFYNADLFQKAGLTLPPPSWDDKAWTYSAFLDAAQKLTLRNGTETSQWGTIVNTGWRPWASFVYSNGGTVVQTDSASEATAITLTDTAAGDGLQFLQDLMFKYHVAPRSSQEKQGKSDLDLFMAGTIGMVVNNPGATKTLRAIKEFTWDVAALPIGDQAPRRGTGGGGTGWAIAQPAKHADAAWGFIAFIATEKAELEEVAIGGTTPSRTAVATSKAFIASGEPPKSARTFPDGQKYVVRDPVNINWPQVQSEQIGKSLGPFWQGTKTARDVAVTIKQVSDPLLQQGLLKPA